jgi:hypothetical protein
MGGLTPKAAIFILGSGITDGTAADEARFAIGFCTGATNEGYIGWQEQHNVGTSVTDTTQSNVLSIGILDPGAGTTAGDADFDSFITNGVRINWQDAPDAAYLMTVILFGGTDLSAHANVLSARSCVLYERNPYGCCRQHACSGAGFRRSCA